MDETNLVKRVREERVPEHIKRGRPKKNHGMRWWKRIWKRGLCINDVQDRNKWRRCFRNVVDLGKQKRSCHQGRMEKMDFIFGLF